MPRPTNRRRPGATLPDTPQVIAPGRVIPRAVPESASSRTGLEQLGAVLSGFFNSVAQSADALAEASMIKDRAQAEVTSIRQKAELNEYHARQSVAIGRENEQQQAEAQARALSGGQLTEAELQDWDYVNAYGKTLGRLHASQMSQAFAEHMATLPPGTDLETAKNEWVSQNLLAGSETADPVYMTELLGGFESKSASIMAAKREEALNVQMVRGVENLQSEIVGNYADLDPADLPEYFERATQLMPHDPERARGLVVGGLLLGARNSPGGLSKAVQMLHSPESGDGVRSFAEMFPAQMAEMESQAVQDWQSGVTWEAGQQYDDLSKRLAVAETPEELFALLDDVNAAESRYGKGGKADALRGQTLSRLNDWAATEADFNRAVAMMNGAESFDASHIKKWQPEIMKRAGISWKTDPRGTAQVIQRSNFVIAPGIKSEIETALVRGSPSDVQSAVETLSALEDSSGKDPVALGVLSADSAWEYRQARTMMLYEGKTADDFILERRQGYEKRATARSTSWATIMDKSAPDATSEVYDAIDGALDDEFGVNVEVSPYIQNLIGDRAKYNLIVKLNGQGDPEDVIKTTTRDMLASGVLQPVPGPDGNLIVSPVRVPMEVAQIGPDGSPMRDADGRVLTEQTVPFGKEVLNPGTGEMENTIKVWEQDRDRLSALIPGVEAIKDENLFLDGNSEYAPRGLWVIMDQDGVPLHFGTGHTYNIGGKKVVIPTDIMAAQAMLSEMDLFPPDASKPGETSPNDRFVLIPRPDDIPPSFILGYKPGFNKAPLPGIEEKRKNWKPPENVNGGVSGLGHLPVGDF